MTVVVSKDGGQTVFPLEPEFDPQTGENLAISKAEKLTNDDGTNKGYKPYVQVTKDGTPETTFTIPLEPGQLTLAMQKGYKPTDENMAQHAADIRQTQDAGTGAGQIESAARGFANPSTFGFADEIAGAGDVVKKALSEGQIPSSKDALGAYRMGRDNYRSADDAAWNTNPIAYGTGYAGSIIPGLFGAGSAIAESKGLPLAQRVIAGAKTALPYGLVGGAGGGTDDGGTDDGGKQADLTGEKTFVTDADPVTGAPRYFPSRTGPETGRFAAQVGLGGVGAAAAGALLPLLGAGASKVGDAGKSFYGGYSDVAGQIPESSFKPLGFDVPRIAQQLWQGAKGGTNRLMHAGEQNAALDALDAKVLAKVAGEAPSATESPMLRLNAAPETPPVDDADSIMRQIRPFDSGDAPPVPPTAAGAGKIIPEDITKDPALLKLRELMVKGANDTKAFSAAKVTSVPGNQNVENVGDWMNLGTSERRDAQNFNSNDAGQVITPILDNMKKILGRVKGAAYGTLNKQAAREFDPAAAEPIQEALDTITNDLPHLDGNVAKVVTRVKDIWHNGVGLQKYNLQPGELGADTASDEMFNRLQAARQLVDKQGKLYGSQSMSDEQEAMQTLRSAIDDVLKTTPSKQFADRSYRELQGTFKRFFKATEFGVGSERDISPETVGPLFNDNAKASRFRRETENLAQVWDKYGSQVATPDEHAAMQAGIDQLRAMQSTAAQKRLGASVMRAGGPTSPQVAAEAALMNKRGIPGNLMTAPGPTLNSLDQSADGMSRDYFGKRFDDLDLKTQLRILKATAWNMTQEGQEATQADKQKMFSQIFGGP